MKKLILNWLRKAGYEIVKYNATPGGEFEREPEFLQLATLCKPFTMTSVERLYALYTAVKYILDHDIPGDFAECGVWRGGSAMLIAGMLARRGVHDRKLYMYDTYEGMSAPTEDDRDFRGKDAATLLEKSEDDKETSVWCLASLEEVRHNMTLTEYPMEHIHFIQGKVEDTIPVQSPPGPLALLRLDTDWYESTRHELEHLYPLLVRQGVLIIDDYGHWEGCRKAVDEYFSKERIQMLLHRIDYTGRIGIKG